MGTGALKDLSARVTLKQDRGNVPGKTTEKEANNY